MKCLVCGKNATGIHYGIPSCEGCKAFYRRGVEGKLVFFCRYDDDCIIRQGAKGCCKACRFRKCKELGMSILGLEAEKEDLSESESYFPRRKKRRYETDNELTVYETGKRFLPGPHDSVWTILPQNRVPQLTTVGQQKEPRYSERSDGFKHNLLVTSYQQYETEQFLPSFDFLDSNPRSLSGGLEPIETILFFRNASLQRSPPSLPTTAQAVALAIQIVFGDQFSRWQRCMDRALNHAEIPHQPETTLETMIEALSYHNADNINRVQKFGSMLPGMNELDLCITRSVTIGWKWVVFWMIHHSAYLTRTETYVTVGSQQLHYCRYWQELISDWPLLIFIYKFCGDFQDIGFNQTEKYLLLAVIMFEPDIDEPERNTENYILKLEYLHKHYTDVLFQVLKSGRTDGDLNRTCRRLEDFFNSLRKIYQMHGEYSRVLEDSSVNQHPAQSATTSIWWRKYHLFDRSGHVERRFSMWEPSKLLMK